MGEQRGNRAQRRHPAQPSEATKLEIPYVKSNFCRVIHVDGAYGGPIAPSGVYEIYMALYSQHQKFPDSVRFIVDPVSRTARPAAQNQENSTIVREIEIEVMMSLPFAKSLRDWLDDKIQKAEQENPEETLTITDSTTEAPLP
jgi:hypothetical protein